MLLMPAASQDERDRDQERHLEGLAIHEASGGDIGEHQQATHSEVDSTGDDDDRLTYGEEYPRGTVVGDVLPTRTSRTGE